MDNLIQTSKYFYGLELMQYEECDIEPNNELTEDPRFTSLIPDYLINEYRLMQAHNVT